MRKINRRKQQTLLQMHMQGFRKNMGTRDALDSLGLCAILS